uniref:Allene oxide synthase n=1 Tax=Lilium regale TaxID=82328 RepID=A0A248SMI0_LILRE|nr:allene oxide synthase [Lilium regale]
MNTKIQPLSAGNAPTADEHKSTLPIKPIPGCYGIPFISPIKDRLDFYYFQGNEPFFTTRIKKYDSTVFRTNMPPGPFMASNPRVIAVLDAASFPVLFDVSKVEKKNVFTGTYMPSTSLTGGYRVCSYLDPSEANHTRVKQLLFDLLASRKSFVIPSFQSSYSAMFDEMEKQVAASGESDFNKLNDDTGLDFLGDAYFGTKLSATAVGSSGPTKAAKWLIFSLTPLVTLGLPKIIEEIFLHTFPLPPFLVKRDYKSLYEYFRKAAGPALDRADELGLSREEATHNLLFATVFNSYGGLKVLFPSLLASIAKAGPTLHSRLAEEVRAAVEAEGGKLTLAGIEKMELVKSVVYEALRIDPPVKFQYGKAKKDLVIESHDAAFEVKKGEMLFGFQPLATKDEKVFVNASEFVGDRFVGEDGKKLLKYVYWSNGFETESPTVGNKQCAGKNFVVLVARLLVVEFFLRYDTFTGDVSTNLLGVEVKVKSLTKAGQLYSFV